MKSIKVAIQAAEELTNCISQIDQKNLDILIEQIKSANRIFLVGAGRSLLVMKAFAMRLMHLGFEVFVVGDVTTPSFKLGDLLIVASASGETKSLLMIIDKVDKLHGLSTIFTTSKDSSISKIATNVVTIPAYTDKLISSQTNKKGILPGGSLFEETVFLLADSLIVALAKYKNINLEKSFDNHANLE